MGVVYLARSDSGEPRAIKVLHAELSSSQELRARLEREASVLQRLRGDRSATVYEVNTSVERPYLVMEYVPGQSLDKYVEENGKLSGVLAWAVMDALLEATEMFHAEGVTHRDLKPSNVMLGEDGVKIIDFGISGLVGSSLTELGSTPATTLWSSPEQMNGAEVGTASDVFNLGMLFVFAWTGKHPFEATKRDAAMLKLMSGAPNLDGVPSRLGQIIAECLAKDPARRPSAREVRDRLHAISRSSSNSDSGSGNRDRGSLTGTVLVNVAEEIAMRSPQQPRQGVALNYRRVSIVAIALLLLLIGAVVSTRRGDGGTKQSATESTDTVDTSVATVPIGTLDDFRTFRQLEEPSVAVFSSLELNLRLDPRHIENGTEGLFQLKWFDSKCKQQPGKSENYLPIIVQFASPDSQLVGEFQVALNHVAQLLQDSESPLSGSIDAQFVSWNGKDVSPIRSKIKSNREGNVPEDVDTRNDDLLGNFGLEKPQWRPLRITLSESDSADVDSRREKLEEPVRNLHSGIPSGFLVDLGWAIPNNKPTSFDPKEIDAAAVTVSSEHWKGVNTEGVLLTLVRAILLGLGSPLDAGFSGVMSVSNGEFLRENYGFGGADYELASVLGHQQSKNC